MPERLRIFGVAHWRPTVFPDVPLAWGVLERAVMKPETLTYRTCLLAVLISMCHALPARAQANAAETFAAIASVKNAAGQSATAPLTVLIRGYDTDAQRDELLAAVKKGGSTAGSALLAKREDLGLIQLGSRMVVIKYAYARQMGAGRLITVVTAEPITFIMGDDFKPTAGHELGLVLLQIPGAGAGTGEMAPAAKVTIDDQGAIVAADHSEETVHLTNVAKR